MKAIEQAIELRDQLRAASNEDLLSALSEEYQAWLTENFDDNRIEQINAAVTELSRRMRVHPAHGRDLLVKKMESEGIRI